MRAYDPSVPPPAPTHYNHMAPNRELDTTSLHLVPATGGESNGKGGAHCLAGYGRERTFWARCPTAQDLLRRWNAEELSKEKEEIHQKGRWPRLRRRLRLCLAGGRLQPCLREGAYVFARETRMALAQGGFASDSTLGALVQWKGPTSKLAISLATAIDAVMNILRPVFDKEIDFELPLLWPLNVRADCKKQRIFFTVKFRSGQWESDFFRDRGSPVSCSLWSAA